MSRQGTLVQSVRAANLQQLGQRLQFARSMVPAMKNGRPAVCIRYRGLLLAVFGDGHPVAHVSRPKCTTITPVKSGTPWSAQEKHRLRRDYATIPMAKLRASLHRTADSIYHQARIMGLSKPVIHRKGRTEIVWIKKDDDRLRRLYPRHTARVIAQRLKRPLGSVTARINRLELVK